MPSSHNFEAGTGENPTIPRATAPGKDFYRIFGSDGNLSLGAGEVKVEAYGKGVEKSWLNALEERSLGVDRERIPFDKQVENLVGVVRGIESPRCTGEDGLSALVVCEAVIKAMESGQAVDI